MMRPCFVKITALSCLPIMFVSCATTGPAYTAHNPRIVAARRTYTQGLVLGTAAGALVGLEVGRMVARNSGNAGAAQGIVLAAVLIGAGVGAFTGGLYARHVVNQRNAFANAELYLDGCIAQARHSAQRASNYNNVLAGEIAAIRRGDPAIRGMIEDSRSVLSSLENEIALQRGAIEQGNRDNASRQHVEELCQEVALLERKRDDLRFYIERMNRTIGPSAG